MKLTVWGARGSVPVSGSQYARYGGDTTCVELRGQGGEVLILDAGTGLRALGNKLLAEGCSALHLALTHAHWDHVLGFPFFKPLYQTGVTITVHGCLVAQQSVGAALAETMRAPYFPVSLAEVAAQLVFDERTDGTFAVGGLQVRRVPLSHPNGGCGFIIEEQGRRVGFFPDNELTAAHPGGATFDEYAAALRGVDLLIHDAEWLPAEYQRFARGWGHSVYHDAVRLAAAAGVPRLVLWHLNQDRSDDEIDALAADAQQAAGPHVQCLVARTGLTLEV